jgi:hypothetical protein
MQVEPHQAGWSKNDPCEEYEDERLCDKAEQHRDAEDDPAQRLTAQEDQQALRSAQVLTHLPNRALTLGAPKLWPKHCVSDVLHLHVTPNYVMTFTSHNEIPGKNSSSSVRSVSLIRNGITPR